MESPLSDFNIKLRRLRHYCGYTQNDLADFLNVTQPAYQKMERRAEPPRTKRLQQIAEFYEVAMADLLFEPFEALISKAKKSSAQPSIERAWHQ